MLRRRSKLPGSLGRRLFLFTLATIVVCDQLHVSLAHRQHDRDTPGHPPHLEPGMPWDAAMKAAVGTVHFKHHPPPVLYTIPGSGNTWVRMLIDQVLKSTSGSIYDDHEIAKDEQHNLMKQFLFAGGAPCPCCTSLQPGVSRSLLPPGHTW